jgi:uncharacterized protein (DUF608 family)
LSHVHCQCTLLLPCPPFHKMYAFLKSYYHFRKDLLPLWFCAGLFLSSLWYQKIVFYKESLEYSWLKWLSEGLFTRTYSLNSSLWAWLQGQYSVGESYVWHPVFSILQIHPT